jgi:predicted alternative tryptophan synthase beta-subunit
MQIKSPSNLCIRRNICSNFSTTFKNLTKILSGPIRSYLKGDGIKIKTEHKIQKKILLTEYNSRKKIPLKKQRLVELKS